MILLQKAYKYPQYGHQYRRCRYLSRANIRKHPFAQRSIRKRPTATVVYPEENETSPTSQRIREKTRGSATRAFGHEQEYQGYFCSVSHTRSQSNNNCSTVIIC